MKQIGKTGDYWQRMRFWHDECVRLCAEFVEGFPKPVCWCEGGWKAALRTRCTDRRKSSSSATFLCLSPISLLSFISLSFFRHSTLAISPGLQLPSFCCFPVQFPLNIQPTLSLEPLPLPSLSFLPALIWICSFLSPLSLFFFLPIHSQHPLFCPCE